MTSGLNMALNTAMDAKTQHPDAKLIKKLGGPTEVAKRLGLDKTAGAVQRVSNWQTRGIPAAVRLQHFHVFGAPAANDDSAGRKGKRKRAA